MDKQCICPCEHVMHLIMAGFASIGYIRGKAELRELSFESNVSAVGCVKQNLSGKEYELCHVPVIILCLFLAVLCVGLQCVIGAFPGHSHLLFKLTFSIQFMKVVQQEQQNFL